jgi:hypothetical protein
MKVTASFSLIDEGFLVIACERGDSKRHGWTLAVQGGHIIISLGVWICNPNWRVPLHSSSGIIELRWEYDGAAHTLWAEDNLLGYLDDVGPYLAGSDRHVGYDPETPGYGPFQDITVSYD